LPQSPGFLSIITSTLNYPLDSEISEPVYEDYLDFALQKAAMIQDLA
jgi:hypothetical protein